MILCWLLLLLKASNPQGRNPRRVTGLPPRASEVRAPQPLLKVFLPRPRPLLRQGPNLKVNLRKEQRRVKEIPNQVNADRNNDCLYNLQELDNPPRGNLYALNASHRRSSTDLLFCFSFRLTEIQKEQKGPLTLPVRVQERNKKPQPHPSKF